MKPTHRTQPYRRAYGRPHSPVLAAMKRGRSAYAPNPMDAQRAATKRGSALLRAMRRASGARK